MQPERTDRLRRWQKIPQLRPASHARHIARLRQSPPARTITQLQPINDTPAPIVIGQDMGDEQQSVHSLSGGESFLVSLALALGLALLSSNRVCVESLFIYEGFGSQDADTLRIAMNELDGLKAMGHKVGVISHVQEITERISTRILVQRTAGRVEFGRGWLSFVFFG